MSPNSSNSSNHSSPATTRLHETCPTPIAYTGTVCKDALQQYNDCLPGNTRNSTILLSQDGAKLENMVASRLELVELFAYSRECVEVARPLLCAFYFSAMCDSKGRAHRLSKQQCMEASQGVCKKEWNLASGYVPDCNSNLFTTETQLIPTCSAAKKTLQTGNYKTNCACH